MAASGRVGDERRGYRSTDGSVAVADRTGGWVSRADAARLSGEAIVLPWDEDLACIIRRFRGCASSEPWPMARLRHLMTDRALGKEPTITPECHRPGWYLWPATRPRSTAIRMNCGRHGFRPGHARERGPAAGHQCLARLAQGTVCKLLGQAGNQAAQGALLSGNAATLSSSPRWRKFSVSTASVQVLKKPLSPRRRNRTSRSRSSLTTRSLESRSHRHDGTGFAASARPPWSFARDQGVQTPWRQLGLLAGN